MRLLIACLLCVLAFPAAAQIYKYTDANGKTVFTNQPPDGTKAETVQLPPTNTVDIQAPANVPPPRQDSNPAGQPQQPPYQVLQLDLPSAEAIRANDGSFNVDVILQPALGAGHTLRLLLDDKPYGAPYSSLRLPLSNIDRGEHSLAVEVLSGGQPIQQSTPVTFSVQRVNTQSPALRAAPKASN
jgi:hypothetical protein